MAKRMKTIKAGRLVKTILYTAPEPRDGERARAEKSRMTAAAQKAMNDKTARGKLEMLIAANFTGRDLFVALTYRDADLPAKRAGAVKLVRQFLKNLRKHRALRDQVLRYIYTTEEKHGEARLHHHLVLNAVGRDIKEEKVTEYGSYCYIKYRLPAPSAAKMDVLDRRGTKQRTAAQQNTGPAKSGL